MSGESTTAGSIYLLNEEQREWINRIQLAAGPNIHLDVRIVKRGTQPYEIAVTCTQRFSDAALNPRAAMPRDRNSR